MDKQEISDLAEKASKGDEHAFEMLVKEKSRHILYYAFDILNNHHDAEDAAQDIVVKMYQNIGDLREPENFNAWLHRIIHNVCISKLRKSKFYRNDLDVENIMDSTFSDSLIEKDRDFLPQTFAEDSFLSSSLLDTIKELPKRRRRAVLLYFYEDLSQKEIAQVMGVSESTVASNILRAKSDIKKKLKKKTGIDIDSEMRMRKPKTAAVPVLAAVLSADAVKQFGPESVAKLVSFNYADASKSAQQNSTHSANVGVKVAAAVTAAGVICGGAFIAASEPVDTSDNSPATKQQTEQPAAVAPTAPAFTEDGEIVFTGGECDCGHENPSAAILDYKAGEDGGILNYKWEILDDGGDVITWGTGDKIDVPGGLANGSYTAKFILTDEAGNVLNIERDFEIK